MGTRKASHDALMWAERSAEVLAKSGVSIVSGGALGIDAAAHRGALRVGDEDVGVPTIAVLGTSIDRLYPLANMELLHRIEQNGFFVSEFAPGVPSFRSGFLLRNRIIAALSEVVVVVQAPFESGALSTLAYANRLGKKTAIVPWNPNEEMAAGSNRLLGTRAQAVLDANDILRILQNPKDEIVSLQASAKTKRTAARSKSIQKSSSSQLALQSDEALSELQKRIISKLKDGGVSSEELCVALNLGSRELSIALTELELIDRVRQHAGRFFAL